MASIKDLVSIGMNGREASFLGDEVADSLVANGNASQADALQLTASINTFMTCTASNNSARLPTILSHKQSFIVVRVSTGAAADLNLYPAVGEAFSGLATDGVLVVPVDHQVLCFKRNTASWIYFLV